MGEKKTVLVVLGLPGSGKSFFARHLADNLAAGYLNTDMVRKKMNKKRKHDDRSKQMVYDQMEKAMVEEVRKNDVVILDGTFQTRQVRKQFIRRSGTLGIKIRFIQVTADDETIRERMEQSRRYTEDDYEIYRVVKDRFEPVIEPHLRFDTDQLELDRMIEKTRKYLYG